MNVLSSAKLLRGLDVVERFFGPRQRYFLFSEDDDEAVLRRLIQPMPN